VALVTAAHRVEHARAEDFLRSLPDASVDSVVTDPPYGLSNTTPARVEACLRAWLSGDDYDHGAKGFMGREWDGWVPGPALWREVLRVLKPGGHALVFAGSRTVDLMGLALRLAGFEIRDTMQWLYGSGFPKSLDVSKALDKAAGAERDVVGVNLSSRPDSKRRSAGGFDGHNGLPESAGVQHITAPATDAAREWAGWGTALKPAHEPVIVARRPLIGTVASNVLAHGTGALNIDGCRVAMRGKAVAAPSSDPSRRTGVVGKAWQATGDAAKNIAAQAASIARMNTQGRWPTNVVLIHPEGCEGDHNGAGCVDGCPVGELGRQSGSLAARGNRAPSLTVFAGYGGRGVALRDCGAAANHDNGGTAARFFPSFHYCAKASRSEREAGLVAPDGARANRHPTVKPIDAMRWLCRLVTRPGGLVLDPFAGSGTTGCAAALEGFRFVGCEMDEAHADLARRRIAHWAPEGEPDAPDCDVPQLDLFGAAS
jgi:DNA modification methylase